MREAVQRIYKERKALVSGLKVAVNHSFSRFRLTPPFRGRWVYRCETGRSFTMCRLGPHHFYLPAGLQPVQHHRILGTVGHNHPGILLHIRQFGSDTL